jgi:hypothetical protein
MGMLKGGSNPCLVDETGDDGFIGGKVWRENFYGSKSLKDWVKGKVNYSHPPSPNHPKQLITTNRMQFRHPCITF